jgi:hypothetical protein
MLRNFILLLSLVVLFSCTDDADEKNTLPSTDGVSGYVQKGPFISGSNIIVQELDEDFNPTGQSYTVSTIDDFGSFVLHSEVTGTYVEFIAQGFYFNEVSGEISGASLTLRAIAKVEPDLASNVNILTTLSKNRIIHLVKEEGMEFNDAKTQAEREILALFNIALDENTDFNAMDIQQAGLNHAALLAISSVVQGDQTVGQLSELISKIILDIEDNGRIDNQSTRELIISNAEKLNLAQIRNNIFKRYEALGLQHPIPPFEKFAKRLVPIRTITTLPVAGGTDVPYDITTVSVTFNKALDLSTITGANIKLTSPNEETVPGSVAYDDANFTISFVPDGELLPEITYSMVVTSQVKTYDETAFSGMSFSFSTLDIDIDSNLSAWFPFEANTNDATGNGYDAFGQNVSFTIGISGDACHFSGEGSYLEIPNVMNMSARVWTYTAWFNLDELPDGTAPFLLASRLSGNSFWDIPLYIRSSIKSIATYNETALNMGNNVVNVNQWHHVGLVINNGRIEMYLDGVLMASKDDFLTRQTNPGYEDFLGTGDGSYEYYTGKYYISEKFRAEFPAYMKGAVDNVRFYGRALNKYEIKKLFDEKK